MTSYTDFETFAVFSRREVGFLFPFQTASGKAERVNEPFYGLTIEERSERGTVWERPYFRNLDTGEGLEILVDDMLERGFGSAVVECEGMTAEEQRYLASLIEKKRER